MVNESSIDALEVSKFASIANYWWDKDGPLKTLHDINPLRIDYIKKYKNLSGERVLDIGSGGGILAESMAQNGAIVTGIDVDNNIINVAAEHAKKSSLNIKYECVAVEDFSAEPFAVITCLEMLEHVSSPELIIKNASRLLMPGGYLFLSTINRTVSAYLKVILAAEYVLNILPRQTHDYHKFIKPSELTHILRKYDLHLTNLTGVSYNPFTRQASINNSLQDNYLLVCQSKK